MFKKYTMRFADAGGAEASVDFYVNSKKTRGGFMHRACAIGSLPRLDHDSASWCEYDSNSAKLMKARYAKISYVNRTWEHYLGESCLSRLWDQLKELSFLDMGRLSVENPFEKEEEPEHEDLREPDELFYPFERRGR